MSTSRNRPGRTEARATGLIIGYEEFTVCLDDGRQVSVSYHGFPRLEAATPPQRSHFEVYAGGRMLHWSDIDEDIEVQHIVDGRLPVKMPAGASAVAEGRVRYPKA